MPAFGNISHIFPLNWRFLPAIDDQVELLFVRDLDSHISQREVDAVQEFLNSTEDFHVMRDHPQHDVPILGGTWGIKLEKNKIRQKIKMSIEAMKKNPIFYASRSKAGPDQDALRRYVW